MGYVYGVFTAGIGSTLTANGTISSAWAAVFIICWSCCHVTVKASAICPQRPAALRLLPACPEWWDFCDFYKPYRLEIDPIRNDGTPSFRIGSYFHSMINKYPEKMIFMLDVVAQYALIDVLSQFILKVLNCPTRVGVYPPCEFKPNPVKIILVVNGVKRCK